MCTIPNNTLDYRSLMKLFLYGFLLLSFVSAQTCSAIKKPHITAVIIVDQFAYHLLEKTAPFFQHGLKRMLDGGIIYKNAIMPHGMPSTATGHAGLSTGTFAINHGIVANHWFDKDGENIASDDDNRNESLVFKTPTSTYSFGKSSRHLMVDTLSDQFVLQDINDKTPTYAYALSLKSRAAIATAGSCGKAIWFDTINHQFTSSKAYFEKLPIWLTQFNQDIVIPFFESSSYYWKSVYPSQSAAYAMTDPKTYRFVTTQRPLVNTTFEFDTLKDKSGHHNDTIKGHLLTPAANQLLLNLTKTCAHHLVSNVPDSRLLLWVCISSTDKLGHYYGPDSMEMIDMLYHLDQQLGVFMDNLDQLVGKDNILYALTADHGVSPIPELVKLRGYQHAQRVNVHTLIKKINSTIEERYGINQVISQYKTPWIYLNKQELAQQKPRTKKQIMLYIRHFLEQQPGIKRVVSIKHLNPSFISSCSVDFLYAQQQFKDRTGQMAIMMHPYAMDTKWDYGTDHRSPYDYDTHVPLILYWPDVLKPCIITRRVLTLQLANTLASLIGTARPSASRCSLLPLTCAHRHHASIQDLQKMRQLTGCVPRRSQATH